MTTHYNVQIALPFEAWLWEPVAEVRSPPPHQRRQGLSTNSIYILIYRYVDRFYIFYRYILSIDTMLLYISTVTYIDVTVESLCMHAIYCLAAELRFVATVTTGRSVKFVPAV